MEEIKVGEYVISQNRLVIGKIIDIENDDKILIKTRKVEVYIGKWNIKKHSFELVDLIEVGDYINGHRVVSELYGEDDNDLHFEIEGGFNNADYIAEKNIKTIVTKEQFESISYKVV